MAIRYPLKERLIPLPGEEYEDKAGTILVVERVSKQAVFLKGGVIVLFDEWCRRRAIKFSKHPDYLRRVKDHPASGYSA